jgi:serine/threonine-protein kinase
LSDLKRLGKYQIEKKIGAGGMGTVFLARDTELKRTVALKVLPRDKAENPILVRRFRAEAQAAAQLRHPNIVAVYDSGEADGFLYIAMEYVEGFDLFEMVTRRGVVPIRRSIDIIKQVAGALQHAFEQNIVHRDIKPSNLLIRRDGVVKLTDLGLARSIDDTLETNITRAGTTVGTVDYMAPEQARNSKLADIRSDLYSLGCTWFQMLTGAPPYPEGSVTNKLHAHAVKTIPDPRDQNPKIPEGLTAVMRRLMAKKPEDRYQTPADLVDELNQAALTQAAISREIFSDLSDYEQSTDLAPAADEADSDDGYFDLDDVRRCDDTPDEVSAARRGKPDRGSPDRGKPVRPDPDDDPADTPPVTYRSKSRATPQEEPEDEEPTASPRTRPRPVKSAGQESPPQSKSRSRSEPARTDEPDESQSATPYRSKPRPIRPDRSGSESDSSDRSSRGGKSPEVDENDEQAPSAVRKQKSRSGKPDANEAAGTTKAAGAKQAEAKPVKSNESGPKPMPPKRQPVSDSDETRAPFISGDRIRQIAALAGVVLMIAGVGWVISRYSTNVAIDIAPFGAPADPAANPVPAPVPAAQATAGSTDPSSPDATTVTVIGETPTGTRPEDAAPKFDVEPIPEWAEKEVEPTGLQILTVGQAARSATNFHTLAEALNAVPEAGAVIKLQGAGPFPLPQVELTRRKQIVISSGAPQDRPVILLKPGEGQTTAGIKVSEGSLDLRGLHFSIDLQAMTDSIKVVEVVDGQLLVRRCSFTAAGKVEPAAGDAKSAIAMVVQSTSDSTLIPRVEPNLLIDRVLVRGDGLGGVAIRRANVDAVIRESLMATGSATAIEVSGHTAAGIADIETAKPRRILRLSRCTLSGQNRIFDLSVDEAGKPPQTAVSLRDVICAAQGVVPNSTILFAGRWPQVRSAEGWLTRLTWSSTNTLYLGFDQLVDLGSSYKVTDAATWQRVWNMRADVRQFQKINFPEAILDELNVTLPQEFDSNGLSYREVKASDGGMPGCSVNELSVPDIASQRRAAAISLRPALPARARKSPEPVEVRKVDLKKEDLGQILSRGDWPSGTLFEAIGGGVCFMSPAKIDGKTVRIEFRQSDGASLRVQPLQPKSQDRKSPSPALISITRGTLELTNAVLEGYANPKGTTPDWLLQSTDSTVILNGCRLLGSDSDASRHVGLIHWITAVPEKAAAEPPALVIRDCYLAGMGCGIRADCAHGSLIFRNSVLAIRGDAIDLRPIRAGKSLLPIVDAEQLTISASKAAIRFEAAPGTEPVTAPVRVFIERSVFAPPLVFKAGEAATATMLQCVGPVIEQHQLEWWGATNGVARRVVHLVRREGDPESPTDDRTGLTAWKNLWDKASTIRMLTGDKGVYLAGELPVKWKDLKPESFDLHKSSQAATWADGGRPIGANTQSVEASSLAKKSSEKSKPTVAPNVSTKKNVGF